MLKLAVVLTSFAAQSPLDGADTAIWLAASPEVEGVTGEFWNKRKEIRCKYRDPSAIAQVSQLAEHQIAAAGVTGSAADVIEHHALRAVTR